MNDVVISGRQDREAACLQELTVPQTSRRTFLAMTGGGLAAGAVLVAPEAVASPTPITETESSDPNGFGDSTLIVAYIQDPSSGRLTVAVGDREFGFYDPDLTRKLGKLAEKARD